MIPAVIPTVIQQNAGGNQNIEKQQMPMRRSASTVSSDSRSVTPKKKKDSTPSGNILRHSIDRPCRRKTPPPKVAVATATVIEKRRCLSVGRRRSIVDSVMHDMEESDTDIALKDCITDIEEQNPNELMQPFYENTEYLRKKLATERKRIELKNIEIMGLKELLYRTKIKVKAKAKAKSKAKERAKELIRQ